MDNSTNQYLGKKIILLISAIFLFVLFMIYLLATEDPFFPLLFVPILWFVIKKLMVDSASPNSIKTKKLIISSTAVYLLVLVAAYLSLIFDPYIPLLLLLMPIFWVVNKRIMYKSLNPNPIKKSILFISTIILYVWYIEYLGSGNPGVFTLIFILVPMLWSAMVTLFIVSNTKYKSILFTLLFIGQLILSVVLYFVIFQPRIGV